MRRPSMKRDIFLKNLYFNVHGHILNWFWRPRLERRRIREEVKLRADELYTNRYLHKYIPAIVNVPEDVPANDNTVERIFTIWLQGEEKAPNIVKACFRTMRHHCSQELIVLDENTIGDWITLPDYIMEKYRDGRISRAHYADICRVELLYRYGGIWLDATAFVTRPVPDEIMKEDFFIYKSGSWHYFVQNCFIRSRRGNYLIKAWREAMFAYWKGEDGIIDYFAHQKMFRMVVENNPIAAEYYEAMPKVSQDPTHLLWWHRRCRNTPFDRKLYEELTAGAFFQKTEYHSPAAQHPASGSFSEYMQNLYR